MENIATRIDGEAPECACGYDGPGSHCYRCHATDIPVGDLLAHLQGHGYVPARWPDGDLAIIDTTVMP